MTQALPKELHRPAVPISYVQVLQDLLVSREIPLQALGGAPLIAKLSGVGQGVESRIPLAQYRDLCLRALELSGDDGLGLAFGLRAPITAHGLFGYGLMSQPTLNDAFEFMTRFVSPLRLPAWRLIVQRDGEEAVIDAIESIRYDPLHVFACEQLLASMTTSLHTLLPGIGLKLLFDYPEPRHFARYRSQLPNCLFDTGVTQLRIASADLHRALPFANASTAHIARELCSRESEEIAPQEDIVANILRRLAQETGNYPSAEQIAADLCISSRTLVRRLSQRSTSFRELLEQVRRRDAMQLLRDPTLTVEDIASRLGYSSGANFTRAFKSWAGITPREAQKNERAGLNYGTAH